MYCLASPNYILPALSGPTHLKGTLNPSKTPVFLLCVTVAVMYDLLIYCSYTASILLDCIMLHSTLANQLTFVIVEVPHIFVVMKTHLKDALQERLKCRSMRDGMCCLPLSTAWRIAV